MENKVILFSLLTVILFIGLVLVSTFFPFLAIYFLAVFVGVLFAMYYYLKNRGHEKALEKEMAKKDTGNY